MPLGYFSLAVVVVAAVAVLVVAVVAMTAVAVVVVAVVAVVDGSSKDGAMVVDGPNLVVICGSMFVESSLGVLVGKDISCLVDVSPPFRTYLTINTYNLQDHIYIQVYYSSGYIYAV